MHPCSPGIQIMHNNGVTHATVRNDYDGVLMMLKWLAYMPKDNQSAVPVLIACPDPVDRLIEFSPTRNPYDPRWMLAGRQHPTDVDQWESGFFDRGTWDEIMAGWAKTVVCGRA